MNHFSPAFHMSYAHYHSPSLFTIHKRLNKWPANPITRCLLSWLLEDENRESVTGLRTFLTSRRR